MTRLLAFAARAAAAVALALAVQACSERLATPGDCPELCPGGQLQTFDTTLFALPGQDSSHFGYVDKGSGPAILVSNGLDGAQSRAFVRFLRRSDSVLVQDTLRPYTIDSVAFILGVLARDTAVKNLRIRLYRLPATVDTVPPFAELDGLLTPAALIDSIVVPDTIRSGQRRVLIDGDELARVELGEEDGGILRIGLDIAADAPTGARIGSLTAGTFTPLFLTYVTAGGVADTNLQRQVLTRGAVEASWSSDTPDPTPTEETLVVGGAPSYRTLLRFPWSVGLRDSVTIVRARLELLPAAPIPGLPSDTATVVAQAIVADLGAKSPLLLGLELPAPVPAGPRDTISLNVVSLVGQWQGARPRPPAIFLSLVPEAASFTTVTLAGTAVPARAARLRIAYVRRFPFENP